MVCSQRIRGRHVRKKRTRTWLLWTLAQMHSRSCEYLNSSSASAIRIDLECRSHTTRGDDRTAVPITTGPWLCGYNSCIGRFAPVKRWLVHYQPTQWRVQNSHSGFPLFYRQKIQDYSMTFQDPMKNFPGPFLSPWMFKYKEKKTAFTYNIQSVVHCRKFSMKQNVLHYCCLFSIWTTI